MGPDPLIISNKKTGSMIKIAVADDSVVPITKVKDDQPAPQKGALLLDDPSGFVPRLSFKQMDGESSSWPTAKGANEDEEEVVVKLTNYRMKRGEKAYSSSSFSDDDVDSFVPEPGERGSAPEEKASPTAMEQNERMSATAGADNAALIDDAALIPEVVDETEEELPALTAVQRYDMALLKAERISQRSSDLLADLKQLQEACRRDMMSNVSSTELFSRCYRRLTSAGFTQDVAHRVLREIPASVTSSRADEEEVTSWLEQAVLSILPETSTYDAWWGGCRVLCALGNSGSGKSTAIAKMAARYLAENQPDEVVILTLDVEHPEPLKTYASVLGVDFKEVEAYADLPELLKTLAHKKLVLIDTEGMGGRHKRLGDQLKRLASCEGINPLLILNATTELSALNFMVSSFQSVSAQHGLAIERAVISKTDETEKVATVLNVAIEKNLTLVYESSGSDILDDFDLVSPMLLVRDAIGAGKGIQDLVSLFGRVDQAERFESMRITLLGNLAEMSHVLSQTRAEFKRAGLLDPGRGVIGHFDGNLALPSATDQNKVSKEAAN